jgi:cellulose synthase operon protein C
MESLMRRQTYRWDIRGAFTLAAGPWLRPMVISGALLLVSGSLLEAAAQTTPGKGSDAEKVLIDKAKALESRGRPDIAKQVWQQILLSDPNNAQALEGLARDYRLTGDSAASDDALDKLRKINPSNPNIRSIQGLSSNKTRDARLAQAGALAKAGNPEAAMRIFREYYGDHPPDGDIALAYYETLYATPNGKQAALSAMRAAAARNPGDPRFIVTLGRMLTYDAKTRTEGIKILHEHSDNADAQNALRQALIWDSANPTSAAELREYLKTHPKDAELQDRLKTNEGKLAEMNAGIARTPAEKAAFAALNAHHLADAEARFQAMLNENEKDARAAAGMGFLRMQQNNFAAAISYLVQAEQNGFRDRSVAEGLATSRFWFTMGEASSAFDANQLDVAEAKYKAALEMRPRSMEALNGLAGIYTKQQQYPQATAIYQQILKMQPSSLDGWRGQFLSYARNNQNQQALAIMARMPAAVKASLNRDPDFLRTLATIYQANGRDADAQRVLAQALALPFPDNGTNLKTGTRLQYAGILMAAKRYEQAAELYKQILNDDTASLPAWMGLITADHQLERDAAAIGLIEKMPPDTYEAALTDAGFLTMLGSIYQQSNQFEIAQGLLERAARMQAQSGQVSVVLQIQLASVYLQRNNTAQAYGLYKQILELHPDNLDAWRGLIGTLQVTDRNAEALAQIKAMPPDVRKQLETDVVFLQSEASLYATSGDSVNAMALFNRVQKHYQTLRQEPPADIEVQGAYLLYNAKNDRALYPVLMRLGARQDLTAKQRETIQGLWANWSVRRSATAFDAGNTARAIDILDAAAQAFPDNLAVRKAVAGGYLRAGRTRESLAIFKQIDFQDASAADFRAAIGSALAANDKAQAEQWLRQALERFPRDAGILASAARFEQARGDNARAADYWRASLAAMPEVSPADKLAHELVNPEPPSSKRPMTASDLAHLLNPDDDSSTRSSLQKKLPPLPAYGRDPYDPSAPVVLPGQAPSMPSSVPVYQVPTSTQQSVPTSDLSLPGQNLPLQTTPSTTTSAQAASKRRRKTTPDQSASVTQNGSGTTGRMHVPATDQTVTSTETTAPANPLPPPPQQAPVTYPQLVPQSLPRTTPQQRNSEPQMTSQNPAPTQQNVAAYSTNGLRLSSQPMNPQAARAQALLSDETDAQLTQAYSIRYLPNATIAGYPGQAPTANSNPSQSRSTTGSYSNAQYTPSAQDAAAGAYSAQKQPTAAPPPQTDLTPPAQATQPPAPPTPDLTPKTTHKKRKVTPQTGTSVPTLVTAPGQQPPADQPLPVTGGDAQATPSTTTTGLTDEELKQRNLPPLRGPWTRLTRQQPAAVDPREEAEMQLRTIEGGYSPWLGGTGVIAHRTGQAGYDGLTSLESQFEASVPLGTGARLTFIAHPAFLDSGQATGNAVTNLTTGLVPTPFGSGYGATVATDPGTNPPPQQNAAGIGGEAQLTFGNLSIAGGYTPHGFLISNWTARASWRPGKGPFTFSVNRDSVKDTQLSFAGLRDPYSATSFNQGTIWGGVMANSANVQFSKGDLNSGFYVGAGGQYLTGLRVLDNRRFDGSMGAYWRVFSMPEYGTLNVGANFFGMHYTTNLQGFTVGMGGYFSPQAYFLANVPITWTGHYLTRWHYTVLGSFGVQAFEQNSETIFPLQQPSVGIPALPALTSVGPNFDVRGQVAYAINEHWFVGGFAGANNSRNYTTVNAGFSVRYLFRPQPSTVAGPTGLFQTDDQHMLRPLTVP